MNTCPHHKLRPELPPLTPRIAKLPVDERGYPVPFFVQWVDENNQAALAGTGRPEFRMADGDKWVMCIKERLCWTCGETLGRHLAFPIGPMCCVNRVTSEPPSHLDCAKWSVRGCPFLSKPKMVRREDDLIRENKDNVAGIMIERNPGITAIWVAKRFTPFRAPKGYLLSLGEPESVEWFTEGRPATRDEVLQAIDAGLPTLLAVCPDEVERKACHAAADLVRKNYIPK